MRCQAARRRGEHRDVLAERGPGDRRLLPPRLTAARGVLALCGPAKTMKPRPMRSPVEASRRKRRPELHCTEHIASGRCPEQPLGHATKDESRDRSGLRNDVHVVGRPVSAHRSEPHRAGRSHRSNDAIDLRRWRPGQTPFSGRIEGNTAPGRTWRRSRPVHRRERDAPTHLDPSPPNGPRLSRRASSGIAAQPPQCSGWRLAFRQLSLGGPRVKHC
jgi:hypothetical protein